MSRGTPHFILVLVASYDFGRVSSFYRQKVIPFSVDDTAPFTSHLDPHHHHDGARQIGEKVGKLSSFSFCDGWRIILLLRGCVRAGFSTCSLSLAGNSRVR